MSIFISHSNADVSAYGELCDLLDREGIPRFDQSKMLPSEPLAPQLLAAIEECAACVFLATARSLTAGWCLAEVGAFWGGGKRVIIYSADPDLNDGDLPPQFKGTLRANDDEHLLKAVRYALREHRAKSRQARKGDDSMTAELAAMTQIGPRAERGIGGQWLGSLVQAEGHAGKDYPSEVTFGLNVSDSRIRGTFMIWFPDEGEFKPLVFNCFGKAISERYLRLSYDRVDEKYVHFGTVMAWLDSEMNTMEGTFLGYGGKSKALVTGSFHAAKSTAQPKSEETGLRLHALKVDWRQHSEAIRRLRHSAFVVEQDFTGSFINDDRDPQLQHVCLFDDEELIGCVRFGRNGRIERLAVRQDKRQYPNTRLLLLTLEDEMKKMGITRLWGYTMEDNMPLFTILGCVATGNTQVIDGTKHYEIEKRVKVE